MVISSGGERRGSPLECRQCHVICERVVSPWRCLRTRKVCVYAFKEGESTYFGCLHKVFAPELDMKAFGGEEERAARRSDPYGPVRATRTPRPQCPVGVERAYLVKAATERCVNPDFLKEVFRVVGTGSEGMEPDATDDRRLTF